MCSVEKKRKKFKIRKKIRVLKFEILVSQNESISNPIGDAGQLFAERICEMRKVLSPGSNVSSAFSIPGRIVFTQNRNFNFKQERR